MRANLHDVARRAGVSRATVDRVLNARSGVRARTREIVLETAAALGYISSDDVPASPSHRYERPARVDFVLPAGSNPFMRILGDQLRAQAEQRPDVSANVHFIDGFSPETLAAKLIELERAGDGIGLIAMDHPLVRRAVRRLVQAGTKIVTLVSDLQDVPRIGYVGIDNRTSGRLAGYLMRRFLGPGAYRVALVTGSVSYRGHEEREMGFRQLVAEHPDQLAIVSFKEVHDDDAMAYDAVRHLLRGEKIDAFYSIGGGIGGIGRALEDAGSSQDIVLIGHDLTYVTRDLLLSGTLDAVIDQYPRVQAREAIDQLVRAVKGLPWSSHPLRTQIILQENLPEEFI